MVEGNDVGGVEERQAQVFGHQLGGEVLAAAHELLSREFPGTSPLGKGRKFLVNGIVEPKLFGDIEIALADIFEQVVARHVVAHVRGHKIQQVGDLGIGLVTAPASGNHHETAGRIGVDDLLDLAEMLGVGYRRASELGNLNHNEEVTFLTQPPDAYAL